MLNRLKKAIWTETRHLKVGDKIAVTEERSVLKRSGSSRGLPDHRVRERTVLSEEIIFEEIVSIKPLGQQQVYDIEVEGTHNFVANNILAHNTLVSGTSYFANGTTYYIDSSGLAKFLDLQVTDSSNPGITLGNGTSGHFKIGAQTISANATGVGIGTTEPSMELDIQGSYPGIKLKDTGHSGNAAASFLSFFDSANTWLGILGDTSNLDQDLYLRAVQGGLHLGDSSGYTVINLKNGNVGIGTTNPSYQLQLSTNSAAKPTSNVWTVASDDRIKQNIQDFPDGLNVLLKLKPRTYQYNGAGGQGYQDTNTHIGIIAQEVEEVAPYMIETGNGSINGQEVTDFKAYQGHALSFIIVNAIQELNQKIDTLTQQYSQNFQTGIAVIQDLTVNTLTVKQKLISPVAYIEDLEVKNLVAQTIKAPQISKIEQEIIDLTSKYATASAILADLQTQKGLSLEGAATAAGPLGYQAEGRTVLSESLILTDLQVNSTLITNLLNSKDQDTLFLQPLANAPINLLAGLMTLTPDGKVIINGDLAVTGKVLASKIESLQANLDNLSAQTATISALTTSQITVQKGLTLRPAADVALGLSLQSPVPEGESLPNVATSSASTVATATIPAGKTEITILNTNVTQDTYIYLTPTSSTSNQTLYVKSKQTCQESSPSEASCVGGFTIAIPNPVSTPITFNYWLIQTL